ncbi:hypothetical protein [Microbacterium sp. NPDC055357]
MAKNAAFIGLAGPFGYDYRNPAPRVDERDGSSPNPVLENVLGLLLCYDELVFLAPQFCPADMRDLPYVRFLTDDPSSIEAAVAALTEFDAADQDGWMDGPSFELFSDISAEMCGPATGEFAIDNHTHNLHVGRTEVVGNGMRLDNALRDLWVVAELGLSHTDVIFGSPAQEALNKELERELADSQYFSTTKRSAATQLAALQVPNVLGPSGSYHEGLETIRDRRDVAEFRQYLLAIDAPVADGISLAKEISQAAFATVDELSERYLKDPHVFRSLGVPAVQGALDTVVPGAGSAVAYAAEAPFQIGDRRFNNASKWAPFVVALNRPAL